MNIELLKEGFLLMIIGMGFAKTILLSADQQVTLQNYLGKFESRTPKGLSSKLTRENTRKQNLNKDELKNAVR